MNKHSDTERLLKTSEASAVLSTCPATTRRLVRAKQLRAYRIGTGALRFKRSDLEAYLSRIAEGSTA